MANYQKFNNFVDNLSKGNINLNADTFKVMLTNTAPVATNSVYGDISGTEVANGNGYVTGGAATTPTLTNTTGTEKLVGTNVVFTATGAVGPFRYAVLYDSSAAVKSLIGFWDYGSSVTLANADTFTIAFDGTNGILQLA